MQEGVPVTGGSASFARPAGIGAECAVWIRRAWKDLGFALAGSNGLPNLRVVSDMVDGEPFSLRLTNARPSTFVYNVVGFTFLGAPFYGGTFVPDLAFIVPGGTNASGVQVIETPFPPGFPSGASAFIQCWQEDPGAAFGFAGSNGVQGVAP